MLLIMGSVAALLVLLLVLRLSQRLTLRLKVLAGISVSRQPQKSCPHLGVANDPFGHGDKPSDDHRCYLYMQRDRIDLVHQKGFCLSSAHHKCPWLMIRRPDAPPPLVDRLPPAAGRCARQGSWPRGNLRTHLSEGSPAGRSWREHRGSPFGGRAGRRGNWRQNGSLVGRACSGACIQVSLERLSAGHADARAGRRSWCWACRTGYRPCRGRRDPEPREGGRLRRAGTRDGPTFRMVGNPRDISRGGLAGIGRRSRHPGECRKALEPRHRVPARRFGGCRRAASLSARRINDARATGGDPN